MKPSISRKPPDLLPLLGAVYCLASFAHFFHNAEFCVEYPNLPSWITRSTIYAAWIAITVVGAIGFYLMRGRSRRFGLVLIIAYAAVGFDGLGHYVLAPMSWHSAAMNLTIWLEVIAAAFLFVMGVCRVITEIHCRR